MSDKIKQALQWLVDIVERELPDVCSGALGRSLDAARAALASLDAQQPKPTPPDAQQPKLVLALPDYEKRRIVIASDEIIDDERLVCVAIKDAQPEAEQPPAKCIPYLTECPRCKNDITKCDGLFAAAPVQPVQPASKPEEHDAEKLATGIHNTAVLAGIIREGTPLTGSQCLMLLDSLAHLATRCDTSKEASDAPKQEPLCKREIEPPYDSTYFRGLGWNECLDAIGHPAAQPCQEPAQRDDVLPNLPAPTAEAWGNSQDPRFDAYTAEQMRDYAKAAIRSLQSQPAPESGLSQPCQSISDAAILTIARRCGISEHAQIFEFARAVRGEPAKTGEAG